MLICLRQKYILIQTSHANACAECQFRITHHNSNRHFFRCIFLISHFYHEKKTFISFVLYTARSYTCICLIDSRIITIFSLEMHSKLIKTESTSHLSRIPLHTDYSILEYAIFVCSDDNWKLKWSYMQMRYEQQTEKNVGWMEVIMKTYQSILSVAFVRLHK